MLLIYGAVIDTQTEAFIIKSLFVQCKKNSHSAYLPSLPYEQFWCVHFSHHGILAYQKDKDAFKPT